MQGIEFIPAYYYTTVYYTTLLVITWFTVLYYIGAASQKILHAEGSPIQTAAFILTVIITLFLGLRQASTEFGDAWGYAMDYIVGIGVFKGVDLGEEWLWGGVSDFSRLMGFNVNEYFLFIEFFYIGGMFLSSWILMRKNLWIAMLFFFTAFQTFSFGTNGIRNGMACSIELVAIALVVEQGPKRALGVFLMFLALGIHRSTMLPTAAALSSIYLIKETKWALRFWIASIFISLVAGSAVTEFFTSLGFDDRMARYSYEATEEYFSGTGFRWDFWLYSFFPVLMIWYVTRYRRFNDVMYNTIANVYLLCNAFWLIVIRSSFSNRFAYLSWFIYPVVMAFPLLRMNLWKDQDRRTALILFFYSGFTFFMFYIYYFGTGLGYRGLDLYWWRD